MAIGTVKSYSNQKGFGFIKQEDGPDVYVHPSAVNLGGTRYLYEGARVSFDIEQGKQGPTAKNVTVI